MKVSVFKNIRETENPSQVDVSKILEAIKNGRIKDLVTSIQDQNNKKLRQQLKKKLPCVLFSGTFSKRSDDAIIKHSGLICLDFDEFDSEDDLHNYKDFLKKDQYTYCVFISPSGAGLKALVKVPSEKENHRLYFRGLEQYYDSPNFDSSCINESRVCYMSYDEHIYINENSKIFKTKVKEEVKEHLDFEIEVDDKDKIIDGLYKWWSSKFGIVEGERNRNVYILAMALNEFGISKLDAKNFCSQFAHTGFDENEINSCVVSAYNNTHLHNTKKFGEIEEYSQKVEKSEKIEDKTKINLKNIFDSAFIDVTKKIEHPPTAISIGNHKVSGVTYPTDFATYGNFSCLVGASKSRKTFFKSMVTACFIGGESDKYASIIKNHRDRECFVLDIDTEQSPFHSQKVFQRTMKMVGVENYEYYKPFALRPYEPKERLQFLEWLIYESDYKSNIGLVCIDGLADLVNDFNDLKESQKVVQKVMKWTDDKQFHLTTILHSNFGSNKAVGHIGSSVLKKAETVCTIKSSEGITSVDFTHTRGYPINEIQIEVNDDGIPVIIGNDFKEKNKFKENELNPKFEPLDPKTDDIFDDVPEDDGIPF